MGLFCSYLKRNKSHQLQNCILNNDLTEIIKLVQNNRDIIYKEIDTEIDEYGNTPLLFSIKNRKIESLRCLLQECNADPNRGNNQTYLQPLHMLAMSKIQKNASEIENPIINGTLNTAFSPDLKDGRKFSNVGSDLIASYNRNNVDISSNSVTSHHINEEMLREMIRILVEKGADINGEIKTIKFKRKGFVLIKSLTPLLAATLSHNDVAIEEFLIAGSNVNYQDHHSKICAIHIACLHSRKDILNKLIEFGNADLRIKSKDGNTCLHWLALSEKDDVAIFQAIMKNLDKKGEMDLNESSQLQIFFKDFIDQTNVLNQTALMIAAKNNHQNLVKFFLDYNASVEISDSEGLKAIDYAKQNSCAQLINSYLDIENSNINIEVRPNSDINYIQNSLS